jgi:hypothetical protein
MRAGEHNILLDMLLRSAAVDPALLPKPRNPRFTTYGTVTTPMGGPGAGLMHQGQRGRAHKLCLCFHALIASRGLHPWASSPVTRAARRASACMRTRTSLTRGRRALSVSPLLHQPLLRLRTPRRHHPQSELLGCA